MNTKGTLPPKREVARALLLRGNLFVHLDPRVAGVSVPARLREQPQLVLQIGLDMPIPIPDLRVDDDGVGGTLSFDRTPFNCQIGWSAVFALVGDDGRGMVWPDDLPPEIAAEVDREVARGGKAEALVVGPADLEADSDVPRGMPAQVTSLAAARPHPLGKGRPPPKKAPRPSGPPGKPRTLPSYLRVVK